MNHVFYKGKLHSQYDPGLQSAQIGGWHPKPLPQGSWVYNDQQHFWYFMDSPRNSTWKKDDEVPPEYRTWVLINL